MTDTLSHEQRFPLLTASGREMLEWLQESQHAPRYTGQCGHRLTPEYLARVRGFETELKTTPRGWPPGEQPAWLGDFVERCFRDAPFYRRYGARPERFSDIPTVDRADLSREPWSFVPDSLPLDDLIFFGTSGTTGHALSVLSHPETAGKYIPLLQAALGARGLHMEGGAGRVACLMICFQKSTLTYASVSPLLGEAGFAKINLCTDGNDWRDPGDVARFIDACNAEVFTGDPLAFAELARLPIAARPTALLSTAMTLTPGLREQLEARFGGPVLNLYSMTETGPIAVEPYPDSGHILLQPRLYVEILDENGEPCPPGARGEVTLTGGFNEYLPLLRYRTNDYARLEFREGQVVIAGLEGRPPTTYRAANGQTLNNVDVTIALRPLALPQYTLHQTADGALQFRRHGPGADQTKIREALLLLFGSDQRLTIEELSQEGAGGKLIQYTSDLS
jgi:phenylacetate-CoA ligase